MKREDAILTLREKYTRLGRLPTRGDCTPDEVMRIKAMLGPWPRALEAAGLKEPRGDDRLQKNREKRIRAKRARREAKKEGNG